MKYEWDVKKAAINFKKHGISFELGSTVFDDPHHISVLDESSSFNEERWVTLGLASDSYTVVAIHTYFTTTTRSNEVIRIISARRATKKERKQYEEGI